MVIWFTGLSGSGKTTIAKKLEEQFIDDGKSVEVIDGDTVRSTLNKHLGFSREDIKENNELIAHLVAKKMSSVDVILVPIISPFAEDRAYARNLIGSSFVELFVNTPLHVCKKRDVKGLYQEVDEGKREPLIGMDDDHPYEIPQDPDITVRTEDASVEETVSTIMNTLSTLE